MKFISHMGAAGLAPENSAEGILIADRYDPEYIEVDIHITSDGEAVLYHGDIRRNYTGEALDITLEQLREIEPHSLTLAEFLQLRVHSKFLLDIKVKHLPDSCLDQLEAAPKNFTAAFACIHVKPLKDLQKRFPRSKAFISQPYHEGPFRPLELANRYNFDGCSLNKWWVGPITYHMANRSNKELLAFTVDRPFTLWFLHRFFSKLTIISNRPDRCIKF